MNCKIWDGALDKDGYGQWPTTEFGTRKAHRVVFLHNNGYLPPLVCHTCDTPACINPDHLVAGTAQTNMDDKVARGRQYRPIGKLHHNWRGGVS